MEVEVASNKETTPSLLEINLTEKNEFEIESDRYQFHENSY